MIALLQGQVAVRRGDHVVVVCGGVGYKLLVSAETLKHVPAAGLDCAIHTHLIVRDDALVLYGFATEEERDLFLALLGVQSVGPKVALAVLSGGPPRDLVGALAAGDVARLTAVPGIGKRTAERIVVELREKVTAIPALAGVAVDLPGAVDPADDALNGLMGLGFGAEEAARLLRGLTGSVEERIQAALKASRS